jgi:hypothetical protein
VSLFFVLGSWNEKLTIYPGWVPGSVGLTIGFIFGSFSILKSVNGNPYFGSYMHRSPIYLF